MLKPCQVVAGLMTEAANAVTMETVIRLASMLTENVTGPWDLEHLGSTGPAKFLLVLHIFSLT